MEKKIALEMRGITKRFGSVLANHNVDLDVYAGEILAILGENGCGKTTLMNMISGIYYPDDGKIYMDGREVLIRSPKDAFDHRIGMVHQHFKLVDLFTAAENLRRRTSPKSPSLPTRRPASAELWCRREWNGPYMQISRKSIMATRLEEAVSTVTF